MDCLVIGQDNIESYYHQKHVINVIWDITGSIITMSSLLECSSCTAFELTTFSLQGRVSSFLTRVARSTKVLPSPSGRIGCNSIALQRASWRAQR